LNFIDSIKNIDTELFLFLNGKHNAFFDFIMYWASNKFIWIPLYLFFFYLAFKHFGKKVIWIALAAGLLIVLSDQISVHAFKNVFLRYRPCHNLLIQAQVHVNGSCGGTYGFVSSHATNTFAIAMFLFLLLKDRIKYFGFFIFAWASLVSYSRIYNGVHYPADIFVGAILGAGMASLVFVIYQQLSLRLQHNQ
jgi:undecaprenyl-diphosphatase